MRAPADRAGARIPRGAQIRAIPEPKERTMTRSRSITFLATAAVIPLTALALAGCGGGDNGNRRVTAPPKTANGRPATVGVANVGGLGTILVDSQGRTALPVREGHRPQEHLLRCVRHGLAAASRRVASRAPAPA